jgi:4-diphosphocytidyl-2-C-methyl-D-erythritol kinase
MLKLQSPAKINLFLKIIASREDGYHELKSLFAFLDLKDEIIITKADKFNLNIEGEFSASLSEDFNNNILVKTLNLFHQKFNISKNLAIKLVKNIPIGAGLGGGSSNAAVFMKALNEIYQLNLNKKELQKISLELGSDIAFFFEDQACIVSGRGEVIEKYYNFKEMPVLIVNPNINLATKEIYQRFDQNFLDKITNNQNFNQKIQRIQEDDIFSIINNIDNDLFGPAVEMAPEISIIIDLLLGQKDCLVAKMSGSGSTCFGIFANKDSLRLAYNNFLKINNNFFIKESVIYSK